MAWDTIDVHQFTINTVDYYFAPTELIYVGVYNKQANQVVQEAESGQVKVLSLDGNTRLLHEFRLNKMPGADRTIGGVSIRGISSLLSMIETAANFQANTIEFWPATISKAISAPYEVRFWSSSFKFEAVRKLSSGSLLYGNGSQSLTFREDIT